MHRFSSKIFVLLLSTIAFLAITGCSGGGGSGTSSASSTVGGGGSKGPFQIGSTVVAYKLTNGVRASDTNKTTVTTDSKGSFSFGSAISWSGPTEFIIYGDYLNENTGTYMNLPKSNALEAISDASSAKVNINIFTNIAAPGIMADLAEGTSIATAKATAKENIKKLFNLDLDGGTDLTDLDLTSNGKDNTQLLLVSAAILKTANPEQLMRDLADDMADGEVDDAGQGALAELKTKVAQVNIEQVAATMEAANIGVAPLNVANVFNGTLSLDNNISFAPTYGAFRATSYTSSLETVSGIIGTAPAAISVSGGYYSIDGAAFTATAGTVTNGQKVRVKGTSSADYSSASTVGLTIGGGLISYVIYTKSDPFVADTTPDAFSFGYENNQLISASVTSSPVTITGINSPTIVTIDSGTFDVNASGSFVTSAIISNNSTLRVKQTTNAIYGARVKSTVTIGDVNGTFSSFTIPKDTTPDAFTFTSANDVNISTLATSNIIIISGINAAVPISISGGEMNVNNAGFTTSATTIANGKPLVIRGTSSADFDTLKTVSVTVGNVISTFNIKTFSNPVVVDATPNSFAFASQFDQNTTVDIDSNTIVVTGINTAVPISIVNGTYDIDNSGSFTSNDGNVSKDQNVTVRLNIGTFDTQETATLTIGGVSATFKAKTRLEDKTPDDFSFNEDNNVTGGSDINSSTITIAGLDSGTTLPISIVNGLFSINSGTFTNVATTVQNNDTVQVQQTTSVTQGAATLTTLTIGSVVRSFTTQTKKNAPVISGSLTAATEDSLYSFTPSTDSQSGEIESWTISNKPSWATFNTVNGLLSGTPTNNNVGTTNGVTITATNDEGSNTTAFDITVVNTNDAPVALNANRIVFEDVTSPDLNISGLISDVDSDNNATTLSVAVTTQPAHGTITSIDGNNSSFKYIPTLNYFGADSFTYTTTDAHSASATATINLTVRPVNDAPVAVADTATTPEDTNVTINVALNDTDVDSAELNVTALSTSANASATFAGGVITYSPALNFNGTDTLTYTISDGSLESNATVTLTVSPVNDVPVAGTFTAPTTIAEDASYSFDANATDGDTGTSFTYSLANNPTWMSISGSTVSGTPTNSDVGTTNGVQILVTDGVIASPISIKTFNITVTNTNDAPVATDMNLAVVKDNDYTGTLTASDIDIGDTLTYTVEQNATNGTVTITDTALGNFTYSPDVNYTGVDSFTFKATDANGSASNIANVNITVADRVINLTVNNDTITFDEDTNATIDVLANDTAIFADDNTNASGTIITAVSSATDGNVTIVQNKLFFVPNANFNGQNSVTYTARTISGSEANATVTLNVTPVNDLSVWNTVNSAPDLSEDFPNPKTLDLNATDVDGNVTYSLVSTQGIVDATVSGATLTISSKQDLFGSESIVVKATQGGVDTNHTITFQVTPVNDVPVITFGTPDATVTTDANVSIPFTVTDVDNNASEITVTATSDKGTLSYDGTTLTFAPVAGQSATATITVTASDLNATVSNTTTFTVALDPLADAPAKAYVTGESLYDIWSDNNTLVVEKFTIANPLSFERFTLDNTGAFTVPYTDSDLILDSGAWVSFNTYFANHTTTLSSNGIIEINGEYHKLTSVLDLANPSTAKENAVIAEINYFVPGDVNVTFTTGAEAYIESVITIETYQIWNSVKNYDTNATYTTIENFFDSNITIMGSQTPSGWVGVDFSRDTNHKVIDSNNALFNINTSDENGTLVVYNPNTQDVNRTVGTWRVVTLPDSASTSAIILTKDANETAAFGDSDQNLLTVYNDGSGDKVYQGQYTPASTNYIEDPSFISFNQQAFTDIENAIKAYVASLTDAFPQYSNRALGSGGDSVSALATADFNGITYTFMAFSQEVDTASNGANITTLIIDVTIAGTTNQVQFNVSEQYKDKKVVVKAFNSTTTFDATTFRGSSVEITATGTFMTGLTMSAQ